MAWNPKEVIEALRTLGDYEKQTNIEKSCLFHAAADMIENLARSVNDEKETAKNLVRDLQAAQGVHISMTQNGSGVQIGRIDGGLVINRGGNENGQG